jgi:hypothetical protein
VNLGRDFAKHFQARYLRACKRKSTALSGFSIDFDVADLRVVEYGYVGETLDTSFINRAIQYVAWDGLQRVSQCFCKLLGVPDMEPMDAPIGPRVIEASLAVTFKSLPGDADAKRRLLNVMQPEFLSKINLLYRDIASYMHALGFIPAGVLAKSRSADAGSRTAPENVSEDKTATRSLARPEAAPAPLPARVDADSGVARRPLEIRVECSMPVAVMRAPEPAALLTGLTPTDDSAPRMPAAPVTEAHEDVAPVPEKVHATLALRSVTENPVALEPEAIQPTLEAAVPAPSGPTLADMVTGIWAEFQESGPSTRPLKLMWVSPMKSLYLWTTRQGGRALCLSAEEMAALLAEGRVSLLAPSKDDGEDVSAHAYAPRKKSA